ncbi:P pilus assembly protein, chaperone PapD [Pseudomonas reinekei]|uniref:Molecular chaperone n=1 Tax=Pseudomonas reinekei TaxID=395598 RepID=A0A1H0LFC1_PSERE|nr:pilus assembly protein [Pseudomonas reinekei]KAB0485165.1 molecular chaperone [Pseudomonas reinekei]OLU03049.1 pilus assembly protein [Pseudomonas reinekei]SDO66773.1 P pilus assembly protein, chaperone PapD [Pseudomonas reinekei]
MKRLLALFGFSLFSHASLAAPQINVGVVHDYLDGDKSSYLKRIFNGGDSTAFVKINILEIIYDADGNAREVPLVNQADGTSRDGLMASPARLIVPANGLQGSRLLYLGARAKERYFRVRYVPVVPEKEDEFALSAEERDDYKKSLSAGVNVLAGYGTVFFVRPKETRFDSVSENEAEQYRIRNNGNSVVVIDELKNCSIKNPQECLPTTKHHILPGRTFQFEKQSGRHYRFTLIEGSKSQKLDIKG